MLFSNLLSVLSFAVAVSPPASELESQVQDIFDDACTMCHDDSDEYVVLEGAPSRLVGVKSSVGLPMIAPGEPDRSYVYLKMVGGKGVEGDRMPQDEDPLPDEKLALIRDWITGLPEEPPTADDEPGVVAPADQQTTRPAFAGTHQIALHTTTTLGRNVYEFRVHHRFGRAGNKRSYGGLAGGAVISLGSGYGIIDGWDMLLRFSTDRLDWELGTKVVPIRQEAGKPFSLGAFVSGEFITQESEAAANRLSASFQLFASRLWFRRWSTQASAGYSLLTNHDPNPQVDFGEGPESVRDKRGTLDVGGASTLWLGKKRKHGIDLEYIRPIHSQADPDRLYYHGGDADPGGTKLGSCSLGWSARTGLHLFQVFLTNTRSIHTNLVAPGGDLGNPFAGWGEFFLGFNLSRRWKL